MKSILCLYLTFLIVSATASAQHHWMPDAHLRRAVNEALGAPADAPFTLADLLKLHRLDPYRFGVKSLKGLEHAKNLTWFSFAEKVSGVDSEIENKRWHTLGDLDGEIYLKPIPDPGGIGKAAVANPRDLNADGRVNILDLVIVANAFGQASANVNVDVNTDGVVNILDLVVIANAFE